MRHLFTSLFSALLGASFAVWIVDARDGLTPATAQAQDRGPRLPLVPPPPAPGVDAEDRRAPAAFDAEGLTPDEAVAVAVYERCNKSVVNITTRTAQGGGLFLVDVVAEGSGSGAVVDTQGHILTNYHVIEDAGEIAVTLHDGKTYDAEFVGADPINDTAVIRIEAPADVLVPVELADSSRLKVGMRVFAIGNPFGLERTMTTGIISSLNRTLQVRGSRTIKSIIQIDAAVNPGNSGGPLLDAHGRLIGINTAIASSTGQSAGVGFAIPSNLVARVVPQLIRHGKVIRPEIGIAQVYETEEGLLIARLVPGGPAEKAGLHGPRVVRSRRGPFVLERVDRSAADLIIAVDGQEVQTADDFLGLIESRRVGETVELTVLREGQTTRVPVVLGGGE